MESSIEIPILYVRHAESTANVAKEKVNSGIATLEDIYHSNILDPDLTDTGLKQANELSQHLYNLILQKGYSNVKVIVSPFIRTMKTSQAFLNKLQENNINHSVTKLVEIVEYIGDHKEITPELQKMGIKYDNWEKFVARVKSFNTYLKNEISKKEHDITIIFGHGLFFSVLLSYQAVQENIDAFHTCFDLANCSISSITYTSSETKRPWKIHGIGSVRHLPDDLIYDKHMF